MSVTTKPLPIPLRAPLYSNSPFLSESKVIDLKGVKGSSLLHELNGCTILETQYNLQTSFNSVSNHDKGLVKIHFQLLGSCAHEIAKTPRVIEQGYFNMFRMPKTETGLNYQGSICHSLEVLFHEKFLKTVVGNLNSRLTDFLKLKSNKEPISFWENNQPLDEKSCNLINEIKTCTLDGVLKKSFLETKVIELIELLFIKKPKCISLGVIPARPPQIEDTVIHKVHTYLHKNLNKNITIPQLAQFAGINTSKLKQDYKQVYGKTIFKHLTAMRMTEAHDLLKAKELTIAHISQTVGYKNPQHFTVAFKKFYGYLPREVV